MVEYASVRPYNGGGPELGVVSFIPLQPEFLIMWLCMGERPSHLLEACPDGFYLETTNSEIVSINDSRSLLTFKFCYIPAESKYAERHGFSEITREYVQHPLRQDKDSRNIPEIVGRNLVHHLYELE